MYSPAPVLGCVQAVVGVVSGPIVSVSPGLIGPAWVCHFPPTINETVWVRRHSRDAGSSTVELEKSGDSYRSRYLRYSLLTG
jgi:hypothetical protein|uniref:Uncharacterized protein n=2 Tax=Picea TaxID=3328 RepID=A0A101M5W4_PICGL|nr:hypothetical protein ABT39_MTgene1222 [Picea glauca]QHR92828.1 hypothetical protein Q903MT_gene6876 [Picea sitchensis]